MADLFVSYKSEDRPRVKPLVEALQADGLSVWWDAQIEAGDGWRQRIQTELEAAKCVLVAWTRRSAGPEGEFVHDEATRAKRRGVYLPVLLEAVDLPLGFGEKQALSLVGWKGNREDERYKAVLAAARAVVAGAPRATIAFTTATGPAVGRRAVIGGGVLLGAAALAGAGWYLLRPGAAGTAAESIAVLPFANLSGDSAQAYLADGLAEELRSALSRIAGLKVAARTSSELMREADVKEAAEKLGVAHVLTGSVRRGGGTIRVNAQLLNGETGLEEWSESYDRPEGDALLVQTGIAEAVAKALSLTLGKAAAMLGGTRNPAAYDAFLRGLAITDGDEASSRAQLAAFDAAIAADPGFAAAHAQRSVALMDLSDHAPSAEYRRILGLAGAAAKRAAELEPRLPLAHAAIAYIRQTGEADFRGADAAFREAVSLPGVGSLELALAGRFAVRMGHADEGMAYLDRAMALDPLNPTVQRRRIDGLIYAGRFDDALAAMDEAARTMPEAELAWRRARAHLWGGRPKEAFAAAANEELPWARLYLQAVAAARAGDRAASDKALGELRAIDDGELAYQFAEIHAARGEIDLAFQQLEQAVKTRDAGLEDLLVTPIFDSMRKDPRFQEIVRRVGFPGR